MNVLFLGYRDWAIESLEQVKNHISIKNSLLIKDKFQLERVDLSEWDLLITLGWSDELGPDIANNILAIGLHCAELDRYSYGSPIQLQVIDGIKKTKHRVFPFIFDEKSKRAHTHTREYSHEIEMSLEGDIDSIFKELTRTSNIILNEFLDDYPDIVWKKWPEEKIVRSKRGPSDSQILKEEFLNLTTEELYNFIRCLTDPYPNAYIEDEKGKLYFKKVSFKKK
tara:strand:- start:35 stop:706 length:672 start_codon:yes stop_codon:yes gene_type:complete